MQSTLQKRLPLGNTVISLTALEVSFKVSFTTVLLILPSYCKGRKGIIFNEFSCFNGFCCFYYFIILLFLVYDIFVKYFDVVGCFFLDEKQYKIALYSVIQKNKLATRDFTILDRPFPIFPFKNSVGYFGMFY